MFCCFHPIFQNIFPPFQRKEMPLTFVVSCVFYVIVVSPNNCFQEQSAAKEKREVKQ
jgi:hypothetical protein